MNSDQSLSKNLSALDLMQIKGSAKRVDYHPERDRFNIPHSEETRVHDDLNANRIVVNEQNIAISTQYPLPHQLETQLQMLVDNRTPALVILASLQDMQNSQLPDYFSHSSSFGNIATRSSHQGQIMLGDLIKANIFKLEIVGYKAAIDIPVIHVYNWPDHQTVSAETTKNLVTLIETTIADKRSFYEKMKSRAIDDPNKLLPVIHCKAGVGRTGQTIAAMVMRRSPELDLAHITTEMRRSRNNLMIQTPEQMQTLMEMANK